MGAMASQIAGVSIVCSAVCSGADQRKHQSSASLVFVRGIHGWPVTGEFSSQRDSDAENVSIWRRHHALNNLLSTFAQRLPVLQSSSLLYLVGCQALLSREEWKCPESPFLTNGKLTYWFHIELLFVYYAFSIVPCRPLEDCIMGRLQFKPSLPHKDMVGRHSNNHDKWICCCARYMSISEWMVSKDRLKGGISVLVQQFNYRLLVVALSLRWLV